MGNHAVGSTWRKWDLHVHTPESFEHAYPGSPAEAWEAFLSDLEALPPDFKVIGINDYLLVEGYEKVLAAKASGRLNNIELILPVLEFRLDKFAGVVKKDSDGTYSKTDWNRINLHVIFDAIAPDLIRQQFLPLLAPSYKLIPDLAPSIADWHAVITKASIQDLGEKIRRSVPPETLSAYGSALTEGFNNLCISLEAVEKAIDRPAFAERALLAVGKTEWDNMKWDQQSIAEKKNVINRAHLVFMSANSPTQYQSARKKLRDSLVNDRLLDCSDAHSLSSAATKDRVGNCFTWIKADPTFEGLRHAIAEFENRVHIGDIPPKRRTASDNQTKYISRITIKKKASSSATETWFDLDIPLNHDLVAIIGNKGSGKSALADSIGLAGNTPNEESFSFLHDTRFRDPRTKHAAHYEVELTWHDSSTTNAALDKRFDDTGVQRVKYLPQAYLERLCNDLAQGGSNFEAELREIIFTHVPAPERLGFDNLEELLQFRVEEIERERATHLTDLAQLNEELHNLDLMLLPEFRRRQEQLLDAKQKELQAHEATKPTTEPAASDSNVDQIKLLQEQVAAARGAEADLARKLAEVGRQQVAIAKVQQAVRTHEKQHREFLIEIGELLDAIPDPPQLAQVISLEIRHDAIAAVAERTSADYARVENDAKTAGQTRQIDEQALLGAQALLTEAQRQVAIAHERIRAWNAKKQEIIGTAEQKDSIRGIEAALQALPQSESRRDTLRQRRTQTVLAIHKQIADAAAIYRTYYGPIQTFVQKAQTDGLNLPLSFSVGIEETEFEQSFLERINRNARGSFSGVEESTRKVRELIKAADFNSSESVGNFANTIDTNLHGGVNGNAAVQAQLRGTHRPKDLADYVFGLTYLRPQYSLRFNGQAVAQLSPGERGLLLLIFYLLVDKDDTPLIIDQPEENLDNQTVFRILVKCIERAKARRQIIIVTHNPNLAVVCDAEQLVISVCDKNTSRFTYKAGALESEDVRKAVVDILEGTKAAFTNRQGKYRLRLED